MLGKNWRKILAVFMCVAGIAGSFYVQIFQGENPCKLCLIIRYSLITTLIAFLISFFVQKFSVFALFSVLPAIVSDIFLIISEHREMSNPVLCQPNSCHTPEFFGIKMSIWAISVIIPIIAISLLEIKNSFK
ncbi:Disulfide bond formation protein B [bacterium HR19]|nr:Disulfide bond formation protein B [bacterium HR19]